MIFEEYFEINKFRYDPKSKTSSVGYKILFHNPKLEVLGKLLSEYSNNIEMLITIVEKLHISENLDLVIEESFGGLYEDKYYEWEVENNIPYTRLEGTGHELGQIVDVLWIEYKSSIYYRPKDNKIIVADYWSKEVPLFICPLSQFWKILTWWKEYIEKIEHGEIEISNA